ncbi:MAG: UDP-N-acetylglucosamine 2-epimerase (hydrolyzing) [Pseudodesulfovibrio sp.]|uniref:UDP-N-acetyl-D-glucosamine 2-epimerase, UDP-hydrolysing n=1 Tax=Pseudodesulfovibrio aespoeensis (strain ATCC 700646 / DSM 10631 / Aspo-2) TaxID=643562 RepID=E6VR15_PSEA9|nr:MULTISPECIES: UDP-N-acetylglucosamine 2-epimerase [Pseudodesulfovibrio]MBU4192244.1 UDP-N-acetylglucosamine 2-epimerase (hydrolyzing) [Pseudomonadota bacterium]ADU62995.1 UDP-N-acetyl-D-glucosamine 2-epimerase, UDP-hydrolysing [Pseudodesulfovibrio aespoeensis Aspo-2]MBU4244471.1 UDP-N-acetylglucosamine 2-epimerase (hydrolyzing) [Pseudomonadota bacterium]MBU4475901.1 UDP-N-acetylglucosamine 2-epimerase (hydrolyzing) [Pseudomonadota bacterium]MBU4516739.1 UDP-N-acetylglucosamine 2-epimerase (
MNICVFTGTRAEYGLLKPIMDRIRADNGLTLSLIVSGSHLSPRHGHTVDAILADGFTPDALVPLPLEDDTPLGTARALGVGVGEYANALERIKPDMLVVLGDRYETFACATAAALIRVPVAHLHGGETTEGAVDEFFRHAVTKMAHLHFASCEKHRQRIIQLGEHPDTVFDVGAVGVEIALSLPLLSRTELESAIGFAMGDKCLLTTYHPVTLGDDGPEQVQQFFAGLETVLGQDREVTVILTGANADPGASAIDAAAARLAGRHPGRVHAAASLGQLRYLSAMKHCAAVVGNSSSGIIEAPSLGVPTVNVGSRQQGRERAASVLDCPAKAEAVARTISRALAPPTGDIVKAARNPYEKTGTSQRIVAEIKKRGPGTVKSFHDIKPCPQGGNGEGHHS